jgi:hypothetical protein
MAGTYRSELLKPMAKVEGPSTMVMPSNRVSI